MSGCHVPEVKKCNCVCHSSLNDISAYSKLLDCCECYRNRPFLMKNINETEKLYKEAIDKLYERIAQLEMDRNSQKDKIDILETEINIVRSLGSRAFHPKKPQRCPVCQGTQRDYFDVLFPYSEYPQETKLDNQGRHYSDCRACDAKGIVWG